MRDGMTAGTKAPICAINSQSLPLPGLPLLRRSDVEKTRKRFQRLTFRCGRPKLAGRAAASDRVAPGQISVAQGHAGLLLLLSAFCFLL